MKNKNKYKMISGIIVTTDEHMPRTEKDAAKYRAALCGSKGSNYPIGMSDCEVIGMAGGCGEKCYLYEMEQCPIQDEVAEGIMERIVKNGTV